MSIIHGQGLSYQYLQHGIHQPYALKDVDIRIEKGLFTAVIGATGSGKSTLMQHLNGIYQPTEGRLKVFDTVFEAGIKRKGLNALRSRIGLVFQFPEHQLFEETLEKDLMFGPMQFGMSKQEAHDAALAAMRAVGLSEKLLGRSPFELSGGQMRKAAIATVLASDPELIVLDEPTATLDPVSRQELIKLLKSLCTEQGKTVIMVTHRLDEVLDVADQFLIMKQGTVSFQGTKEQMLANTDALSEAGIAAPSPLKLALQIQSITGYKLDSLPTSVEAWADWLMEWKDGTHMHTNDTAMEKEA